MPPPRGKSSWGCLCHLATRVTLLAFSALTCPGGRTWEDVRSVRNTLPEVAHVTLSHHLVQDRGLVTRARGGWEVSPGRGHALAPGSTGRRGVLGHQHPEAEARRCAEGSGVRESPGGDTGLRVPLVTETPPVAAARPLGGGSSPGGPLLVEQTLGRHLPRPGSCRHSDWRSLSEL